MTLDLTAVTRQLRMMADNLAVVRQRSENLLRDALTALEGAPEDCGQLQDRIGASRTGWPIARPLTSPKARWPLPPIPNSYTVVATDGSQIDPDRHGPALCYLINIGTAIISYGDRARASLDSEPTLGFEESDLYITHGDRRVLVEGHLLDGRRDILESRRLAEQAIQCARDGVTLAVRDGTLILRSVEGWGEEFVRDLYREQLLSYLEELRCRGVPVCSYISRPRSADVVNLLRLLRCPHVQADCERLCEPGERDSRPCADFVGLLDGQIYRRWLSPGQRSSVFLSPLRASLDKYGAHRVCFFYLHVGSEVTRVEVPEWVALNTDYLDLVHSILYEQCRRGGGYPRVLMEAHEKAIITGAERQQFQTMLEAQLVSRGLGWSTSEKQRSKRLRGL